MKALESNGKEFSLIYNDNGILRPVVLMKEQHDLLQQLVGCIPGRIRVVEDIEIARKEPTK